jgi:hypothetical protein
MFLYSTECLPSTYKQHADLPPTKEVGGCEAVYTSNDIVLEGIKIEILFSYPLNPKERQSGHGKLYNRIILSRNE